MDITTALPEFHLTQSLHKVLLVGAASPPRFFVMPANRGGDAAPTALVQNLMVMNSRFHFRNYAIISLAYKV